MTLADPFVGELKKEWGQTSFFSSFFSYKLLEACPFPMLPGDQQEVADETDLPRHRHTFCPATAGTVVLSKQDFHRFSMIFLFGTLVVFGITSYENNIYENYNHELKESLKEVKFHQISDSWEVAASSQSETCQREEMLRVKRDMHILGG